VAFFIVVCTGATLFVHHIQITEAKDAALALVPLVGGNGRIAELLFGIGLLNASLMAASVLPLSTAYSIAEAFGWERGVGCTFTEARSFSSYILGSSLWEQALLCLFPLIDWCSCSIYPMS
jgi:Mn2+/Fe2+ NRAMP family transporter